MGALAREGCQGWCWYPARARCFGCVRAASLAMVTMSSKPWGGVRLARGMRQECSLQAGCNMLQHTSETRSMSLERNMLYKTENMSRSTALGGYCFVSRGFDQGEEEGGEVVYCSLRCRRACSS